MKKEARKKLEQILYVAIEKVLVSSKVELKNKTENAIHKSIKKIMKKADIIKIVSQPNSKEIAKRADINTDGVEKRIKHPISS